MRRFWLLIAPPTLAALILVGLGGPRAGIADADEEHPEVDLDIECQVCHADETPEVVAEWDAGKHGKFLVKCFICHGSVGDDFQATPGVDACLGCHGDQHISADEDFMSGKSCFTCHPSHRLTPHAPEMEGGK